MDGVRKSGAQVRPTTCHCCHAADIFVVLFLQFLTSHFLFYFPFHLLSFRPGGSGGGDLGVGKAGRGRWA